MTSPYVWIAILVIAGGIYLTGYNNGRQSVIEQQNVETIESAKDATKTREIISRLPDGDAARSLRSKWQR